MVSALFLVLIVPLDMIFHVVSDLKSFLEDVRDNLNYGQFFCSRLTFFGWKFEILWNK